MSGKVWWEQIAGPPKAKVDSPETPLIPHGGPVQIFSLAASGPVQIRSLASEFQV